MYSSIVEAAVLVLNTPDTCRKAELTREISKKWQEGEITEIYTEKETEIPPLEPARPDHIKLVEPRNAPKRGKGGLLIL